jgi:hypothetical protein
MRVWAGLLLAVSLARGGNTPPDQIRDAATRAITLFQASQKTWYAAQTCQSCHHQFQAALAFQSAREHGIHVDEKIAHTDAVKAFDYRDLDIAVQYNWVIEPAMDDAYQLVAANAAGMRPNLVTAVYARLLAARQDADGTWNSFHQRPPRPTASSPRLHYRYARSSYIAIQVSKPRPGNTSRAVENGWSLTYPLTPNHGLINSSACRGPAPIARNYRSSPRPC